MQDQHERIESGDVSQSRPGEPVEDVAPETFGGEAEGAPEGAVEGTPSDVPDEGGPAPQGAARERRHEHARPPAPRQVRGSGDSRTQERRWLARGVPIIHEDDELLVVDKPSGLLTANMPGETRDSLFDMVKEYARRKNRRAKVWIIHRLDKEASGLLVFAKNETAFNWLKEDFKAKRVHRMYLAVVEGEITGDPQTPETPEIPGRKRVKQLPSGTIQSFIREEGTGPARSVGLGEVAKDAARFTARPWRGERPHGRGSRDRANQYQPESGDPNAPRLAVTHYRVTATGNGRSLLQLRLETGRKNQIRVHMQEFGHSIVGDRRYGAQTDPTGRVCLHAGELGFNRPGSGQTVRFFSPAPAAFYRLVGQQPPAGSEEADQAEWAPTAQKPAADTSWDNVAVWYDELIEDDKSDHFRAVILPGSLRLLRPESGMRVLDVACGQGALARRLDELGAQVVGIDASPRLIETARTRGQGSNVRFEVGDARSLADLRGPDRPLGDEPFDAATCVMALMNIDPLEPVFRGIAESLKPGGSLVGVILHPAFRAPGQTSWGWERERSEGPPMQRDFRAGPRPGGRFGPPDRRPQRMPPMGRGGPAPAPKQYRRIDGYLSPGQRPITMNPGYAAHGAAPVETWTFHRPLQTYVKALADAGFLIEAIEEWPSMRQSQPGPRAAEENRARREIPMFLGFRAIKR